MRYVHTHTHAHTSTHTQTLSLSHTHARGTGIQSARACIHREREPLLAEWEQACGTIHFLTRYFARRPHSPPVGTGLFPRHYSFTYNFIFTDTLPAESCGTCFSSYICFCFCCYTDTLPAESCGTCFSSYSCFCFCCYTDTLQAESCGTCFSSYIFFVFVVTQTHYRLRGDWELRHYYLDDCWHVRSEEAERRCGAYDDFPEAWCKSF